MKILDLVQGSPEWVEARSRHNCASDAPVMMGVSKKTRRTELLRMKSTGDQKEFSAWVQDNLLDKGHETEAKARLIIEARLGEDLFPVTASDDDGYLLASFDGITLDGRIGFEHKLWNAELVAQMKNSGEIPPAHHWQLEQQILVAGLEQVIFVCSDGTEEKMVTLIYTAVPGRAEQLLAGWKQFDEDVRNYKHVETLPAPVATVKSLPALSIEVKGKISLVSNLDVFGRELNAFIEGLDKNPSDDQAFADAEAAIKTLQSAQDLLEAAESSALAQTASIDDMRRTVASYSELARTNRLMLERLVKARKETLREDIKNEGVHAFRDHLAALNSRLGKPYMPAIVANFAEVMKGRKTIASLRDAVSTELARVKIESNAIADRIQNNLTVLREQAMDYVFLFNDTAIIVLKANDDFAMLVKARIGEHKEGERKKEDEQRERIRKEEADRLEREQAKRLEDERKERERIETASKPAPVPVPTVAPIPVAPAYTPVFSTPHLANVVPLKPVRPTDDDIIQTVAMRFNVPFAVALAWLIDMDLPAAKGRIAGERA